MSTSEAEAAMVTASVINSCAGGGHGSSDNSDVINSDENGGGSGDRVEGSV